MLRLQPLILQWRWLVDKSIEAQPMYLGDMGEDDFMFIYVDIGKMPPNRVTKYLENVKDNLKLCQMLEDRGINYSLVGCRRDAKPLIKPIEIECVNMAEQELELVPVEEPVVRKRTIFEVDVDDGKINNFIANVKKTVDKNIKHSLFECELLIKDKESRGSHVKTLSCSQKDLGNKFDLALKDFK